MKNVDVLPHIGSTRILRGRSLLAHQTLLARSSGLLYLCDRKIRKNPNPFPIWKIGFGLYWFGAVDETKSEPEAPASVTCPSMDFTRWSSEE